MNFVRKYWFWGLVVVAVLGFVGFKMFAPVPLKGKTFTVKKGDLRDTLSFSGTVDASEKVALKFQSSGRLSWVGVKEGDVVKKFQGIASLDRESLKKTMANYLNTYLKERNFRKYS
jgi:macrolide-specific efflux system membrane fusion protein